MAHSAIELLAWSYFNHIVGSKTASSAISCQSSLSAKDIKDIHGIFEQLFPVGKIRKPNFNVTASPDQTNYFNIQVPGDHLYHASLIS